MPIKLADVVGLNVLSFDSTGGRNASQPSENFSGYWQGST
jgi:hypothetical protein